MTVTKEVFSMWTQHGSWPQSRKRKRQHSAKEHEALDENCRAAARPGAYVWGWETRIKCAQTLVWRHKHSVSDVRGWSLSDSRWAVSVNHRNLCLMINGMLLRDVTRGAQIPARQITMGAPNYCGVREKSQQCHKYFIQYSKFASTKPQSRTWGRQTCFLSRVPSNLVTPLISLQACCRQTTGGVGHGFSIQKQCIILDLRKGF